MQCRIRGLVGVCGVAGWAFALPALAIDGERILAQADRAKATAASEASDAEPSDPGEASTLAFVGEHQPKLLELLEFIKRRQPQEYESAMRELRRTQQRLELLSQRDDKLYGIELELWRVRSKLRLLAAEIMVSKDGSQRKQLERQLVALLEREVAQETRRLEHLRDRAARQVENLERQIAERKGDSDALIATAVKQWQSRIERQAAMRNKPANKKQQPDD